MNILRGLALGGIVIGSYSLGAHGAANGFEYAAETRGTLFTVPAYQDMADQLRDFRNISAGIAVVELAGAGAVGLAMRNKNFEAS